MTLDFWLATQNSKRSEKNLLRTLRQPPTGLIDFCSNDYLGLARSKELADTILAQVALLPKPFNGSTGSRLLSGNSQLAEHTEDQLCKIFESEKSLIFNSGYNANLGVLSCLPQRGDTILYDELCHACIKDGARLSMASRHSFKHNNLNDLEGKLKNAKGKIFIAVESIYSMDGDACPLNDLVLLAEKFNAHIILDEAHSTGVYGKNGNGLACQLGLQKKIAVRVYTFGKAMGIHGAVVVGSNHLINYLINHARAFMYSTALAPHSLVAIQNSFSFLSQHIYLQQTLQNKINLFLATIQLPFIASISAIQSLIISGNKPTRDLSEFLIQNKFDCRPILSPTVKEGTERIRICLHAFNTDDEIKTMALLLDSYQN